jgi:hypothetical protein
MLKSSWLKLFVVGALVVFALIIAGSQFGNNKEAARNQDLEQTRAWHKYCFQKVSLKQINSDPHMLEGKRIQLQGKMVFRARQISGLPSPQWVYGLFCPEDRYNQGKEWVAVYFATMMDNKTLPALKQPVGTKRLYGTLRATEEGEFYLELCDAEDVAPS